MVLHAHSPQAGAHRRAAGAVCVRRARLWRGFQAKGQPADAPAEEARAEQRAGNADAHLRRVRQDVHLGVQFEDSQILARRKSSDSVHNVRSTLRESEQAEGPHDAA
uniref:(northern house mosquito) hypothetical protein n=1 Tax=Culex pipiens TaxID=7175 RepID=A0A8D8IF87_CULPI